MHSVVNSDPKVRQYFSQHRNSWRRRNGQCRNNPASNWQAPKRSRNGGTEMCLPLTIQQNNKTLQFKNKTKQSNKTKHTQFLDLKGNLWKERILRDSRWETFQNITLL
uniref:Uncharacterized protein n=1 Tax=Romanomermis culicivorax TaxID=13658 RepID=A0A915I4L6_ROMCU